MANEKARYWLGTLPASSFCHIGPLRREVLYLRGQLEEGTLSGYRHWQVLLVLSRQCRRKFVCSIYPGGHWEPSRSSAANDYVWKEDTRIAGTQFEMGSLPVNRSNSKDWDAIRSSATSGNLDAIPSDIFVRCYHQLRSIGQDSVRPVGHVRSCYVFWGATGTGKSRRAWEEAGTSCYSKDPRTKWWDGYQGEEHVVIDEFRGVIDISHLLRWFDRYPVRVERKGGSLPLSATTFWITSNLAPIAWYPELDVATWNALERRFTEVIKFE